MLKPTFRFFVIPLGALCLLVALSSQNAISRPAKDTAATQIRQQVTDCSRFSASEICVISFDGETKS